MARRSSTLRFKLLLVFALLVVIVWSVMWFVAATIVDRQIDRALIAAGGGGVTAHCTHREMTGFPFRIELRCGPGTMARSADVTSHVEGLTLAALVYRPGRMIAEARGPAIVAADSLPSINADWELAHASFRLDLGASKVNRMDAEVLNGRVTVGPVAMDLAEFHLNVRENPSDPSSLDFAVRIDQLRNRWLLGPLTATAQGQVTGGAALMSGHIEEVIGAVFFSGAPLILDQVILDHGDLVLSTSGTLNLDSDGLVSGDLVLAVTGEDAIARHLGSLLPASQSSTIATLVTGVLKNTPATTQIDDRPAKEVRLRLDRGKVRVGSFPFALPITVPSVAIGSR